MPSGSGAAVPAAPFLYQGLLSDGGVVPAGGRYDMEFGLWNAPTGGVRVGSPLALEAVVNTNGVFSVSLDFGAGLFDGSVRWLEVSVRTNGSTTPYQVLSFRQAIAYTPQAIFALSVADGSVTATKVGGVLGASSIPLLDASKIATGTLSDARLPVNLARLNGTNLFTGTNEFRGPLVATNGSNRISGIFTGNGAGLTNLSLSVATLDASKITTGTLSDARLPVNLARLNGTNVFTGTNEFRGPLVATNGSNRISAIFSGNGAGLTNLSVPTASLVGSLTAGQIPGLDASKVTSGTLADARLGGGIARSADVTSAINTVSNVLGNRLTGTNDLLAAQIQALTVQVAALTAAVGSGSGGGSSLLPGATFVSGNPADPLLLASGMRAVSTVPAPAWRSSAASDVLTARTDHRAVWTGGAMIVWGGFLGEGRYSGAGATYSPDLDSWTPVSPVNAPVGRSAHTAVWTGSELIIWGGFSGTGALRSGGRYSPTTGNWVPVNTTGAPTAREGHLAAWTGSRMVIWGGKNGSTPLADGASYSPANDTWAALPAPNAPAPRSSATGLWTGDRWLVWGGEGASSELNTGAQLLCVNGVPSEWRSISTAGAPSGRSRHSVVWTGSRMLVWGGSRSGVPLNDGASYNPTNDTWTTLRLSGAPTGRTHHSAEWTGTEMVLFGGETASGITATGGAYDPASDTWRVLANPGSPVARSGAAVAWTGTEILFFGGRGDTGSLLTALQRLTPQPAWTFFRKP
ncbi:MAG: hypothetical protein RIS76_2489 [Verrucomicrobiota bacterium]